MNQVWPIPAENPDYYDPTLSKVRNPPLPAGFNSADINGDELNGGGYNEPVWTMWFDSFEPCKPLVLTDNLTTVFATACPDITIPGECNTITMPREVRELKLRRA